MPEPTKLPSAPSCIMSAASAGVAIPPAQKQHDREPARSATSLDQLERRAELLGGGRKLRLAERPRAGGSRR